MFNLICQLFKHKIVNRKTLEWNYDVLYRRGDDWMNKSVVYYKDIYICARCGEEISHGPDQTANTTIVL